MKQDKINYIRNYYKFIIFNIIKIKADLINIINLYIIFIEIIQKLYSYFDDFDKFILCDTKLYDLVFAIEIIKKNKIFDKFYARFLTIVASLNYIELLTIRTLQRLLTFKLHYHIFYFLFLHFYMQPKAMTTMKKCFRV